MIPVGIYIETGFTEISLHGNTTYYCDFATGANIDDIDQEKTRDGPSQNASKINHNVIAIKSIMFDKPYNDKCFVDLFKDGFKQANIKNPSDTWITIELPYDKKEYADIIKDIIESNFKPKGCEVLPPAGGVLAHMEKQQGTVIHIGYEITEIIHVNNNDIQGITIPKATKFIMSQLPVKHEKDTCACLQTVFKENYTKTCHLVKILADHIVDETSKINHSDEIILAGGGAALPTMKESLEKMLQATLIVPDDPVFSHVIGLVIRSREKIKERFAVNIKTDQQGVDKI